MLDQTPEALTRRAFTRRSITLAALGLGALGAGCGSGSSASSTAASAPATTLDRAKKAGVIRVGFANENPYGYADPTGKLTGEAPTVAGEILKQMGVPKMEGVLTTFDALIPGLKAGRFDMVTAGMFITPERCQEVLFSDPDYVVTDSFAVRKGDARSQGVVDLPTLAKSSAKAGTTKGGVIIDQAAANGLGKSRLTIFPDDNSGMEALQTGRIDVFMGTTLTMRENLARAKNGKLAMTPAFIPKVDGKPQLGAGGYVFRKQDAAFRDQFNAKLKQLQQSGELVELVKPFGFSSAEIDAAEGHSAAELCKAA